jgi:hypothetical protein
VLSLSTSRAGSQPRVEFPVEQPVAVSARVAMLEQRVHRLEQRLGAFEKVGLTPRADGGQEMAIHGATVSIDRDGRVTVIAAPPKPQGGPSVAGRLPEDCDPPYTIDPKGVRTPKFGCLASGSCDPPFYFDAAGIKRFLPDCL